MELRTPTADANPYLVILMMLVGLAGTAAPQPPKERPFEFDILKSLEMFRISPLARVALPEETVELFAELKRREYASAEVFGSFESERDALLKVL